MAHGTPIWILCRGAKTSPENTRASIENKKRSLDLYHGQQEKIDQLK
jgi:hypothetical protein